MRIPKSPARSRAQFQTETRVENEAWYCAAEGAEMKSRKLCTQVDMYDKRSEKDVALLYVIDGQ